MKPGGEAVPGEGGRDKQGSGCRPAAETTLSTRGTTAGGGSSSNNHLAPASSDPIHHPTNPADVLGSVWSVHAARVAPSTPKPPSAESKPSHLLAASAAPSSAPSGPPLSRSREEQRAILLAQKLARDEAKRESAALARDVVIARQGIAARQEAWRAEACDGWRDTERSRIQEAWTLVQQWAAVQPVAEQCMTRPRQQLAEAFRQGHSVFS